MTTVMMKVGWEEGVFNEMSLSHLFSRERHIRNERNANYAGDQINFSINFLSREGDRHSPEPLSSSMNMLRMSLLEREKMTE